MEFEGWTKLSPEHPKPPQDKKCQLLIMGEGSYVGHAGDDNWLEFDLKPEGIKQIVAWREIEKND